MDLNEKMNLRKCSFDPKTVPHKIFYYFAYVVNEIKNNHNFYMDHDYGLWENQEDESVKLHIYRNDLFSKYGLKPIAR